MGIRGFINNVAEFLEVDDFVQSSREKSINDLIKKLKKRRLGIFESIRYAPYDDDTALQKELAIISPKIKKGEKLLAKLNQKVILQDLLT